MSYTAYYDMYCNIGQPYCNILEYAFYRIVVSEEHGWAGINGIPELLQVEGGVHLLIVDDILQDTVDDEDRDNDLHDVHVANF